MTNFSHSFLLMIYIKKVFAMVNDKRMNKVCFAPLFRIFSVSQGDSASFLWALSSPSIQYSIFRNNISMKMVCGQAQPHQIRPNNTVNKLTNRRNATRPKATKWKSCGKNGTPQKINFRSNTLNRKMGFPLYSTQGKPNNSVNNRYEKYVLRR